MEMLETTAAETVMLPFTTGMLAVGVEDWYIVAVSEVVPAEYMFR